MRLTKYTVYFFSFWVIFNTCVLRAEDEAPQNPPQVEIGQPAQKIEVDTAAGKAVNSGKDLPKEIRVEKDGSVMALIPGGEFWMGMKGGRSLHDAKLHRARLDDFYMDKTEVTNQQYAIYIKETGHRVPAYWEDPRFSDPRMPVVGVNWYDAKYYAEWAGKRLPTEAEWERASRGGLELVRFPWGDELTKEDANYHSLNMKTVASYKPNGYGLFDMSGNVWEWVHDRFSPNYFNVAPVHNPPGPEIGRFRCLRGGAFNTSPDSLKCGHRHSYDPRLTMYYIGFRCAKDAE